jgi:hypothetical protein
LLTLPGSLVKKPDDMKKYTLTFLTLCVLSAPLFAGVESSKEIMQQAPPACEWYRAHEWDLNLWGTLAFAGNTGINDNTRLFNDFDGPGFPEGAREVPIGLSRYHSDRFLDRDDAWGGGADLKFFFSKYWGLGVEGFILNTDNNSAGGGLGTFTFRFPIGCSRFAPYGWAGGGVAAGGTHSEWFLVESSPGHGEREAIRAETVQNRHAEALGQFGAGIEVRITPRVGVMTDFGWNLLSGPDNNFGMLRFGATLSY